MKIEGTITKISSKYILREIISFLDYKNALLLVKYNNNIKEKLGIVNEDYSLPIKYSISKTKESLPLAPNKKQRFFKNLLLLINFVTLIFIYIDSFIEVIDFDKKEDKKEELEEEEKKEMKKEIIYRVFLMLLIPVFWLCFCFVFCSNCYFIKKCFKILLALNIINIIMMIIPILKLNFDLNSSYKINKTVFICDIALVILFPIYIIIYFIYIYKFYEIIRGYHFVDKIIVSEFRKFKVNEFILDSDLKSKNIEEQIKIIKACCFKYSLSQQQKELINLINNFREKNNCGLLEYNEEEDLNDYFKIVKRQRLYNNENIISINKNKFLFIYPINEFKKEFLKKDKVILNLLKNRLLNKIFILEKQKNEYILVYHSKINNNEPKLYVGIRINENSENTNNLLNN